MPSSVAAFSAWEQFLPVMRTGAPHLTRLPRVCYWTAASLLALVSCHGIFSPRQIKRPEAPPLVRTCKLEAYFKSFVAQMLHIYIRMFEIWVQTLSHSPSLSHTHIKRGCRLELSNYSHWGRLHDYEQSKKDNPTQTSSEFLQEFIPMTLSMT